MEKSKIKARTVDMALTAMFAALIAVCSFITIPMPVPFTLQTFGVFCAVGMLGGKRGTAAVTVYILLGAVGLPVFAGFRGGISALVGPTGGYIVGFLFMALAYWLITALAGSRLWVKAAAMLAGLAVCYAFGTLWFVIVYTRGTGAITFGAALMKCVAPFVIPDLAKAALALFISSAVKPSFLREKRPS